MSDFTKESVLASNGWLVDREEAPLIAERVAEWAAYKINTLQSKLTAAEQRVRELEQAARCGERWMTFWLDEAICDCEDAHYCGYTERVRDLEMIRATLQGREIAQGGG